MAGAVQPGAGPPAADGWREARYRHSPSFLEVLRQAGCTLLVSTYQAGRLIALGAGAEGLRLSLHQFDQAMGVAVAPNTVAVGARGQIWFLADHSHIAPQIEPAGEYDRCFLPRSVTVTGSIQCHELAWGRDEQGERELWVVNTLFSCLAGLHPRYSFVPRWRPPFISTLAAEDRCHLNGLGMRDGRPAVVTVMAQTDEGGGWRADKNTTGAVLDVDTGEPVTTGLAMPHSPRWHRDRLLVLNSGLGTLEHVDPATGGRTAIAGLPGFTRGLACYGNLAFVGLSRIRETAVFGGVPIATRHEELKCGVGVIDLPTGRTIATLEFESGIEEIFDVQVLPDARASALGGAVEGQDVWVVPSETTRAGSPAPRTPEQLVETALAAQREGRAGEAVTLLRRAATARPDSPLIANQLGNALQDAGDQGTAVAAYERAVAIDRTYTPALQNLGYVLVSQGRTDAGVAYLERAQEIDPSDINRLLIATALPVVYADTEDLIERRHRVEERVAALVSDGVQIDTTATLIPTNFFCAYQGRDDRVIQEGLGRVAQGVQVVPPAAPGAVPPRGPDGRHRIGFLSAYFRDHTIGRLNLGRIARLDREAFEVIVLSAGTARDPMASAFAAAADRFVRVPRDLPAARAMIAEQELDLLLFTDVGMDAVTTTLAHSRLAPVQCATWGHPVTTGSGAVDYFLSSALLETAEADAHYTETLVRLPSLGTYYERPARPDTAADRTALGLPDGAHVYVCPQTLFKFHPEHDELLAEILRADPEGRIVLLEGRVGHWTALLRERLHRVMPDVADRIHWLAPLPREGFLALLAAADVVLDPPAFGGGNSSYEALAMHAPVVTWPSGLMRGRITQALYAKAGYDELVCGSRDEYVATAVALGTDPAHRARVVEQIAEAVPVLFEDEAEVRDLDAFLAGVLGRS